MTSHRSQQKPARTPWPVRWLLELAILCVAVNIAILLPWPTRLWLGWLVSLAVFAWLALTARPAWRSYRPDGRRRPPEGNA